MKKSYCVRKKYFPDAQFHIEGYQYPPFRRDCDKNGGGEMIFIRDGLIAKRLYSYEDNTCETMLGSHNF